MTGQTYRARRWTDGQVATVAAIERETGRQLHVVPAGPDRKRIELELSLGPSPNRDQVITGDLVLQDRLSVAFIIAADGALVGSVRAG